MPDDLFWRLTPRETVELLEQIGARDRAESRAANMRAGLVAAAVYNVNRKRGKTPIQPQDFFRPPRRIVSPEEMEQALDRWMAQQNRREA